jgi:hypothetical protein
MIPCATCGRHMRLLAWPRSAGASPSACLWLPCLLLLVLLFRGRSGLVFPRLSGGGACQVAGFAWRCRHGLGGPGVCAAVGVSSHTEVLWNFVAPLCWLPPPVCCLRCLSFLVAPPGERRVASLVCWSPPSLFFVGRLPPLWNGRPEACLPEMV